MTAPVTVRHYHAVFEVRDETEARGIILTPENGLTTEERWERETDWLVGEMAFPEGATVLDYGCGIGRIAKRLKNRVMGIDASEAMRDVAYRYVDRGDFSVAGPEWLEGACRPYYGGALCVWVLQHALYPEAIIRQVYDVLLPDGVFYVVNRDVRCVPVEREGMYSWADDGLDVGRMLRDVFVVRRCVEMPVELCAAGARFWELGKK